MKINDFAGSEKQTQSNPTCSELVEPISKAKKPSMRRFLNCVIRPSALGGELQEVRGMKKRIKNVEFTQYENIEQAVEKH